jgi:formylmethanofuran dehydrogenase subunit E
MAPLPDELKQLKRFHGHLGPWVVVGYRMGQMARENLEERMWAVSFSGSKVPLSCMVDGIQFSSGCTMGKGNISIQEKDEAKAHFFDTKHLLEIKLHDEVRAHIQASCTKDTEEIISLGLFNEAEENLFAVTKVESDIHERTVKLR